MYFSKFPTFNYPITGGQVEQIQDILLRVGFTDKVKDETGTFIKYNVSEGATPESIAEDVYGDQQFFWVVLLFNDLLDPQYRLPLRSRSLDDFIDKKYRSVTLFLSPESDSEQFFTHPISPTSTVRTFTEGDTITLYLGKRNSYKDSGPDKVLGIVRKYIPELSAIQLDRVSGEIKVGDIISRGYDTEIRAQVRRVSDSRFAVHHFEEDNRILNPMATPPDDNGNQVPVGQTGDGFSSTPVGVTQTVLENYINDKNGNFIVTNEEYEFTQNDVSRELKLLDPSLLENVVRELREVFDT